MIKIIRPGINKEVECKGCGALLGYSQSDIEEKEQSFGPRISYIEKYITCPQCKRKIVLTAQR